MSILFYVQWSSVFNVTNCSVALQHAATESLYVVCITQLVLYMQHCRLRNFVHLHRILQMTVAKDITACRVLIYLKAKSIVVLVLISTVYWLVDFSTVCCQFLRFFYFVVDLQLLRTQLNSLQAYLFSCKQPVAEELLSKVGGKSYLLDSIHVYSLRVCDSEMFYQH